MQSTHIKHFQIFRDIDTLSLSRKQNSTTMDPVYSNCIYLFTYSQIPTLDPLPYKLKDHGLR